MYIGLYKCQYKYQKEYYEAINLSHARRNCDKFIEFYLKMIDNSLSELLVSLKKETNNISYQVSLLLDLMEYDIPLSLINY